MWFRRKPKPDPAEAVRGLRERALGAEAAQLGIEPTTARPHVWGVLMETAFPEGFVTLVAFADGTTSLYFSEGGGIIGAGDHAAVREASELFLSDVEAHAAMFRPASGTQPPGPGRVHFYVKTFDGTLFAEGVEDDLGEGRHALSPVFDSGHRVIAAVQESSEDSDAG